MKRSAQACVLWIQPELIKTTLSPSRSSLSFPVSTGRQPSSEEQVGPLLPPVRELDVATLPEDVLDRGQRHLGRDDDAAANELDNVLRPQLLAFAGPVEMLTRAGRWQGPERRKSGGVRPRRALGRRCRRVARE
jgi:hypothetical protein